MRVGSTDDLPKRDLVGVWVALSFLIAGTLTQLACVQDPHNAVDDDDSSERVEYEYHCKQSSALPYSERILIPSGTFAMGSDQQTPFPPEGLNLFGGEPQYGNETPEHQVQLTAFCIDRYEVTRERFRACYQDGECPPPHSTYLPEECDGADSCLDYPINNTSYARAADFCAWAGGRLCTEAEWERVASGPGPEKLPYPWGHQLDPEYANILVMDDFNLLEPVHTYENGQSAEGVFNLIGNVYEWVSDFYGDYDSSELVSVDPHGPSEGSYRVSRGGCGLQPYGHSNTIRTTTVASFDDG